MLNDLISELQSRGIDVVRVVDIAMLSEHEKRGCHTAVLIAAALHPNYVLRLSKETFSDHLEFSQSEHIVDSLAEWGADFIKARGYQAYAQSERNLINDFYDADSKTTVLPHKKIAVMAGLGWIGKSGLLVTSEYGSALCMCSILTDAPLPATNSPIIQPMCGECKDCKDICPAKVIHGTKWQESMERDLIIDVYHCETCLKCLVHCPWTQRFVKNSRKFE